ncbi:hypothetical protein FI950_25275, partial [Salmonella enterica]|nr:hypothetical protein [Salmonella enterica]
FIQQRFTDAGVIAPDIRTEHERIRTLRLTHGKSLRETTRQAGVSKMTVIRVCNAIPQPGVLLPGQPCHSVRSPAG